MNKIITRSLLLACSSAMLMTSSTVFAATVAQMKACKNAVLDQSKFDGLPMAAVSVYPGRKSNHAHFTVRWEGLKADGHCKVSGYDHVKKVKIKEFHDGRHGNTKNYQSEDIVGFYWDRHIGQWRDPNGGACHTCTPENGFPNHSDYRHVDNQPKNEYEAMMQKEMKNTLSDSDINSLNRWAEKNR